MAQEHNSTFEGSADERDNAHKRSQGVLSLTLLAPDDAPADAEQEIDLLKWELRQLIDAAKCRCT